MEARLPCTALAISLLREVASCSRSVAGTEICSAVKLGVDRVGPLLRSLLKHGLLSSDPAGYSLARSPANITVAEIAVAVDGPSALLLHSSAPQPLQHLIAHALDDAMSRLTLADLLAPSAGEILPAGTSRAAAPHRGRRASD